tara:strand:+ start:624 stop:1373 length:750 start_codon:yes stop_codon:yes gene_type:complete
MKTLKEKIVHVSIISIFVSLYFLVATISMINSVAFFDLSHSGLMSWSLAIGFEIGAAASLAAIVILDKTNKTMVWGLFLLLTAFQMMANSFHAFINLEDYMGWIELFGLEEEEPIIQKRILSIVSGAVLPLVALGFIKSLTDYVRPEETVLTKLDNKETSDYSSESSINNKPVERTEQVIEESLKIPKETEDDVKLNEKELEKKTDSSRISKTKVHHIEKVLKKTNESLNKELDKTTTATRAKIYHPKP